MTIDVNGVVSYPEKAWWAGAINIETALEIWIFIIFLEQEVDVERRIKSHRSTEFGLEGRHIQRLGLRDLLNVFLHLRLCALELNQGT